MRKQRGMNLLELLAAVVIVSILGAIGYPTYIQMKQETRRSDAHSALIGLEGKIQRYLVENNQASLSEDDVDTHFADYSYTTGTAVSKNGYYDITIKLLEDGYSLYAVPPLGSAQYDDTTCRSLWLDNQGIKYALDSEGASSEDECW